MTPYLGILLIILITFIGVRFFSRSTILKTPLLSGLVVSGLPYILIGVILGPQFFGFLNKNILDSLHPMVSMAIGWVGLLFGLQLRWRNIRRFPRNYLLFTTAQSLITFMVILTVMGIGFFLASPPLFQNRLEAIITLAALGSMTAPLSIGRIMIEKRVKGQLSHLLQFISSLDSFWGILIAGMALAVFHPPAIRWITSGWQWILLTTGLSIFIGMLFRFLIRYRFSPPEIFLLVLGLVIFTSGIGFYLQLSPVLMNMIAGITIAQFPRESDKVMRVIQPAEKSVYLFLLIFAGAFWNYRFWQEILLIILFISARFAGKYLGGRASSGYIDCGFPVPADIGRGLLSFGGISLAIALNFLLFYGGMMGDFLMSAAILGTLIFDEYTAFSIRSILQNRGEIS